MMTNESREIRNRWANSMLTYLIEHDHSIEEVDQYNDYYEIRTSKDNCDFTMLLTTSVVKIES